MCAEAVQAFVCREVKDNDAPVRPASQKTVAYELDLTDEGGMALKKGEAVAEGQLMAGGGTETGRTL